MPDRDTRNSPLTEHGTGLFNAREKLAASVLEAERAGMCDDHDLLRETFRQGPSVLALTVAEARELLRDSGTDPVEQIAALATDLLVALQPWAMQRPEIRSAAVRLTVALAALPLPGADRG